MLYENHWTNFSRHAICGGNEERHSCMFCYDCHLHCAWIWFKLCASKPVKWQWRIKKSAQGLLCNRLTNAMWAKMPRVQIYCASRLANNQMERGLLVDIVTRRGCNCADLLRPTAKAKNQMERGLLLDIIIGERTAVFQLLTCENQSLLIWRDTFFVLRWCKVRCP